MNTAVNKSICAHGGDQQHFSFGNSIGLQILQTQTLINYDTASSVLTAANIKFHKFMTYTTKTNPVQYSRIYLAQVRRHFLVIKADSIQGLFNLLQQNPELSPDFNLTLSEIGKEKIASLNARIRKLQNTSR